MLEVLRRLVDDVFTAVGFLIGRSSNSLVT